MRASGCGRPQPYPHPAGTGGPPSWLSHREPHRTAPRRRRGAVGALLALLVAIGLGAPAQAGSAAPPDPATLDRIDAFVEEQRDARRVPGVAFAIVAGGQV